ncbi:MAG: alkaline phosphatase family protein [Steroidobacteraceae bacterium]
MSIRALVAVCAALLLPWQPSVAERGGPKMIILGVDGMDPKLLRQYMAMGRTPNLEKLAAAGGFTELQTSTPPQSPVAWSNFITGMDSGAHGIFDFLHLDRQTLTPYSSTARVERSPRKPLAVGQWRIPLGADQTVQLRDGPAFWDLLERRGVSTTLFQIPANYPPIPAGRALSGMGTPDLKGTAGTFTYYTEEPDLAAGPVSGGIIHRVRNSTGTLRLELEGPPNVLRENAPAAATEFTVRVDRTNPVALIEIGGERLLLRAGEWSEWTRVEFELASNLVSVPGMVRFYLRRTQPHFALYATPVNIDPRDAAQPIAHPASYSTELAAAVGPFYTEEMPEDTKAFSARVLTAREFVTQSELILQERRRLLQHEVRRFSERSGPALLFFYFSTVDQRHHMLARQADPHHPFHDSDTPKDLAEAMLNTYAEIDAMIGWTLDHVAKDTALVVMSDHGFAPFRRQAHLNAWLERHGYLTLKDPSKREQYEWLEGIDWSRTRAFAIGLNSLYLNVRGREKYGIVPVGERASLARTLARELAEWKDEKTGEPIVSAPALREDVYHGPHLREAPDIIVGYARGYRASWDTTTGKIPATLVEDNRDEWSGDHCIDPREAPGVLLVNRPLRAAAPDLRDLTASVLRFFAVPPAPGMRGAAPF